MNANATPKTVPARFDGVCWTCGRPYAKGAPILWTKDGYRAPDGKTRSIVVHPDCGLPVNPTPPTARVQPGEAPPEGHEHTAAPIIDTRTPAQPVNGHASAPTSSSNATDAQAAVDALARLLSQRVTPPPSQLDEQRVRQLARDEQQPLAQTAAQLATLAAQLAQRVAEIEAAPPPDVDPAELERVARAAALDEARAAVQAVQATTKGPLAVVGEIPQADALYHDASTTSQDLRDMLSRGSHVLVSGPSGSGKTFPALQECARAQRRAVVVSCAEGLTYSALVARPSQTTPTLEYRYGPLPLAMKSGAVLIMDEIDKLDPMLAAILHGPLEPDSRRRALTIPETGETVLAAPGFQVVATCNGLRDESGAYSAHRIDGAFLTRCRGIAADYLSLADEQALFERAGLDDKRARELAKTLAALRVSHLKGDLTIPPSTRLGVQWLRMVLGRADDGSAGPEPIAPERAWRLAYLSLLTPAQQRHAEQIIEPTSAARWSVQP